MHRVDVLTALTLGCIHLKYLEPDVAEVEVSSGYWTPRLSEVVIGVGEVHEGGVQVCRVGELLFGQDVFLSC